MGRVVSRQGLKIDPKKIEAVLKLQRPKLKKDVRSFLGFVSYHRNFIPNFARITAPLNELIKKKMPTKVKWNDKCEQAFNQLKNALSSAPILAFPDFSKEFSLETDASKLQIAAVLLQKQDGQRVMISCVSRTLTPAEQNYSIVELECLAVVYGIQQFRSYLFGRHFTVFTDQRSLKWLMKMKNPSGRLARWVISLQQYDFTIEYKPGSENLAADALSRLPKRKRSSSQEDLCVFLNQKKT